jgi:hypothetical protein
MAHRENNQPVILVLRFLGAFVSNVIIDIIDVATNTIDYVAPIPGTVPPPAPAS